MMYQLLNDVSCYIMVIENIRERKFSYTSMYRSLFIRQYKISKQLITWIHKKKFRHIIAMTNFQMSDSKPQYHFFCNLLKTTDLQEGIS